MKSLDNKWLIKNRWWTIVGALFVVFLAMAVWSYCKDKHIAQWLQLLTLTSFVVFVIGLCNTLTNIFSLRKKENGITWCQIIILLSIGLWILGFILVFNIQSGNNNTIVFGIIGGLLTLIFQDKIKGVVTFIHLRANNLLNIGDWIQVPKLGVDGEVRKVTLTTVTLYNWDTTTSTIPISTLHADHFINLQHMSSGKTYGWRIDKTFIVDTECFHAISQQEADMFKSEDFNKQHNILDFLPENEIKEGALNARLYRLYLYHWLMSQPDVSQLPRLVVKWIDQVKEGVQLQMYVFIITNNLDDFEWHQSLVIEHVMESLGWFGLRLYQRPSSYDENTKEAAL